MFLSKQSGYAFTNVRAGQAVHLSPPLKRRAVTTKQRCRVLYLSGRVVSTMSAGYTSEGKIGEGCLRESPRLSVCAATCRGRYSD